MKLSLLEEMGLTSDAQHNLSEFREYISIIEEAYQTQLNRAVDDEGLRTYFAAMTQGLTESQLYEILARSAEAKIKIMNLLKRFNRTSEIDYFVDLLAMRQLQSLQQLAENLRLDSILAKLI